ncbi:HipA domain-containing protein [Variovorax paradoxus]|jgi:serine/threonine-protein kinase HipA|uniref:HipA domain-containing protein n=1 Tax=Variovorax paradoxus TaxID=34073 RepID=UPI003AAE71B8
MVFNAAVTNNDDHPRNHALLRRQKGWRLSPAYDLVPAPVVSLERRDLGLTVGDDGRTASIYNLLSQAGRFGLPAEEARGDRSTRRCCPALARRFLRLRCVGQGHRPHRPGHPA